MFLPDLHNHTSRCGHAVGGIDEYVEAAISRGITHIGFTDHAPLPPELRAGESMAPEETEDYIGDIAAARQKYAHRIEVLTGFEVDYPLFSSFNTAYFSDKRIDYLIGSCHFLDDWAFDNEANIAEFSRRDINEIYAAYYERVSQLVASGRFNVIGHFDIVKKFGHRPSKNFFQQIESLAKRAASAGMAFEVNTSGLAKPVCEMYPAESIVKIFFANNVPVTIGSDAHSPSQVGFMLDGACSLLKKCGYKKLTIFRQGKSYSMPMDYL